MVKTSSDEIREEVADFFENHYKNVRWNRPMINGLALKKLSPVERDSLEESYNKAEVWMALPSCDGNKALCPDGFNLKFIKDNWDYIQDDFIRFMDEFYHNGEIVKDLNQTFIALISKCLNPNTMKDFHPISLVGPMFKVIAKVLSIWMRRVMDTVIEETQMAFVGNNHKQLCDCRRNN
ncbi:hypothetical protein Dsin_023861 [Dipteronia sinensis]|uniref:Reverse transcriptase domain-containing protein n=1 Tax=Dipteronia sinensis TaxID=43782 RepID=A0AAE0A5L1_9ROSI|nr:hypothetical protein Dsin_023861 [Dipteronia sinensis]